MNQREKEDFDRLTRALAAAPHNEAGVPGPGGRFYGGPPSTSQPGHQAQSAEEQAGLDARSFRAESGQAAVQLAQQIAKLKGLANADNSGYQSSRQAAGRAFYQVSGFWIDEKFDVPIQMTFVKWGSDAYFALVTAHLELKSVFALGTRVILVTADGKALVISDTSGAEKLTEQEVKDLFVAAPKPPPATPPAGK